MRRLLTIGVAAQGVEFGKWGQASSKIRSGNLDLAADRSPTSLRSRGSGFQKFLHVSTARERLYKLQEAIVYLDRVIKFNPDNANFSDPSGLIRFNLDDKHRAIVDFTASITLAPNQSKQYIHRGLDRLTLNDSQSGIN